MNCLNRRRNMIDYSLAQYLALLAQRTTGKPLPGLNTKELPDNYTFRTQASLEKLEGIVLANGFTLETDLELMRIYQHESGLLYGSIPFPEMASYGELMIVNRHKEFEYTKSGIPAITYNSCFKYKTQGRRSFSTLEVVANVTEGIMQSLWVEHIQAFWRMESVKEIPIVVSNFPGELFILSS